MISAQEVLNALGISYKIKNGNYLFKCISPSHNDTHPSMSMNTEGVYQCWSCKEKGNLYNFIKLATGKSLKEFVDDYGFTNEIIKYKPEIERKKFATPKKRKLYIKGKLQSLPSDDKRINEYIKKIRMNNSFIKTFNIQYTLQSYIKFFEESDYTFFSDRLCAPVYENNEIVNLIGRDFTEKQTPKELYPKNGKSDTLFNIDNINKNNPVIIVEGFKGLIPIWCNFNRNVVSTFGSSLGKNQISIIKTLPNILLFVDNDHGGMEMIEQIENIYNREYAITAIRKKGNDPADGSLDEIRYALTHPISSIDYYMNKYGIRKQKVKWY